ncbi:MAG TPA: hypothetical protein VMV59_08400 [Candidatus Dormibacteraeota bacterium]|nr:hypothetical protein [Candidatus Dormibacteraeota bacterium]
MSNDAPTSTGQTLDSILSHADKEGPSASERLKDYQDTHVYDNGAEIAADIEQRTRSANK